MFSYIITNLGFIPGIVSVAVFILMIISLYVTFKYRDTEQYKNTKLNVFLSTLASVAIIFLGVNILLSSLSFEYNQRFSRLTKTKEAVDKLWLYPHQVLQSSRKVRPEFIASFFTNNPEIYLRWSKKNSPLTIDAIVQEQFLANVILQSWEDCLTIRKYDLTPMDEWLRSFINWAKSPYLKSYHEIIKYSYANTTNQLAELLFEYAETIPTPVKNINIYKLVVEKMMRDPRYVSLMKEIA
ncbi:MAG: hypothetical protein H0T84_10310 [Tatlockia sp.]|nr:hypothetical protein [Tatlockia sp.]